MKRRYVRVIDATNRGEAVVAEGASYSALHLPDCISAEIGDILALEVGPEQDVVRTELVARPTLPFDPEGDALRWRRPGEALQRMRRLELRHVAMRAIRDYFDSQGFIEVHAPLMIRGTCPDLHVDSFELVAGYLTTSTEYQIKRMVVGGFERIYTLGANFRPNESSERHNPEFTMLEWARVGASLRDIEKDAELLTRAAAAAVRAACDHDAIQQATQPFLAAEWRRVTVRQALHEVLGVVADNRFSHDMLRAEASRLGLDVPEQIAADRGDLLSHLIDLAQGALGHDVPVFLTEWPVSMTASAASKAGMPELADRTELVIRGLELSDGFPWVGDGTRQKVLFDEALDLRRSAGKPQVVLDDRYVAALHQGIPPGAGMALGVDRLMMSLLAASSIRDVVAFVWDEV